MKNWMTMQNWNSGEQLSCEILESEEKSHQNQKSISISARHFWKRTRIWLMFNGWCIFKYLSRSRSMNSNMKYIFWRSLLACSVYTSFSLNKRNRFNQDKPLIQNEICNLIKFSLPTLPTRLSSAASRITEAGKPSRVRMMLIFFIATVSLVVVFLLFITQLKESIDFKTSRVQ